MISVRCWLVLILMLILLGMAMQLSGLLDVPALVALGREYTQYW